LTNRQGIINSYFHAESSAAHFCNLANDMDIDKGTHNTMDSSQN